MPAPPDSSQSLLEPENYPSPPIPSTTTHHDAPWCSPQGGTGTNKKHIHSYMWVMMSKRCFKLYSSQPLKEVLQSLMSKQGKAALFMLCYLHPTFHLQAQLKVLDRNEMRKKHQAHKFMVKK